MQAYSQVTHPYTSELQKIHSSIEKIKEDPLLVVLAGTDKLSELYSSCLHLAYIAENEHVQLIDENQKLQDEVERLNDIIRSIINQRR